jgi:hypothetical protein
MSDERMTALVDAVAHSRVADALALTAQLLHNGFSAWDALGSLQSISCFAFSHQWASIHVPKEHEYLDRLLRQVPESQHSDFLSRFVEYLAWSPKYVASYVASFPSDVERSLNSLNYRSCFLRAMDERMALHALFYARELVEAGGLDAALQTALQIGCNDISQDLGHYFSCTDSLMRLAQRSDLPEANNCLVAMTLFLMQSSPIVLLQYGTPVRSMDDLLPHLVKKGGFAGYHYMIVANALIKNRAFLGETHYLHALKELEAVADRLSDTLSVEGLDALVKDESVPKSNNLLRDLETAIWRCKKPQALAILRHYLRDRGAAQELTTAIAHSFTAINDHPHDPHYVTFPLSAFELIPHLNEDDVELILAHCVEFAIERVQRYGIMTG